jgi:hypothetical protein
MARRGVAGLGEARRGMARQGSYPLIFKRRKIKYKKQIKNGKTF